MKTCLKTSSARYELDPHIPTEFIDRLGQRAVDIIAQKILEFCHLLRAHQIDVSAGRIIDTFRALLTIDCFKRGDFYTVLEANLISRSADRALFHQLYEQFWQGPSWAMPPDPCLPGWEDGSELPPAAPKPVQLQLQDQGNGEHEQEQEQISIALYSPEEILSRKDFGKMSEQELLRVQRLIMSMARQMATTLSRRQRKKAKATQIDPSRTMRRSLRYGGEVVELVKRGPKVSKTKMVVLCDVSGSMDVYSRFLLQFLYGLQNGLRGVETIVFSTRLTRITPLLRRRNIDTALDLIANTVHDWSGGTQIGACLQTFNHQWAPRLVTSKTLVIVISDGWDTGETDLLDQQMAWLKAHCHQVIWLNPLLGSSGYQPICRGMSTALPYVNHFMSVHNVDSLRLFGHLLSGLN
ncbi:MAG: VWA domain-containing protein [bacterium]|nr:VWA domain-containing protein [bacterium]